MRTSPLSKSFGELYGRAADLYDTMKACGGPSYGWCILRSSPVERPPVLFIGFQGGFKNGDEEHIPDFEKVLASPIDYIGENSPFSQRIREAFGLDFLSRCAATNAIVLKAPNASRYDSEVRPFAPTADAVSDAILSETIRLIDPQLVLVIGFSTFDRIGQGRPQTQLSRETGNRLVAVGKLKDALHFDGEAYVTFHFSGARGYTAKERKCVADFIKERLGSGIAGGVG